MSRGRVSPAEGLKARLTSLDSFGLRAVHLLGFRVLDTKKGLGPVLRRTSDGLVIRWVPLKEADIDLI